MKKILKEDKKSDVQFLKGALKSQSGAEYPVIYLKGGDFYDFNQAEGLRKRFRADFDKFKKMWFVYVDKNKETQEYDYQATINNKIKPLIAVYNQFHQINLDIEKLQADLKDYVPTNTNSTEDEAQKATKEEVDEINNKLETFKERLLKIESSTDLQHVLSKIASVKGGQGYTFSPDNKMAIKLQRPDATIVCTAKNWRRWYNRTIKPDAKPIFVNSTSPRSQAEFFKVKNQVTNDYMAQKGLTSKDQLKGNDHLRIHDLSTKKNYNNASTFGWYAFYDVTDTQQIEGTEDQITPDTTTNTDTLDISTIDSEKTTNANTEMLTPIYDGLLAYAKSQRINVNAATPTRNAPSINVEKDVNANSTKLLAKALLSEILHGEYLQKKGGVAAKSKADPSSPQAQKQQAEVASWAFMNQFDVNYNLADVDMNTIFGVSNDVKDKTSNINYVLKNITSAVNHLVDFVNVQIKDKSNLAEIKGGLTLGKHISPRELASKLGIEKEFAQAQNANEMLKLQERLIRKILQK